MNLRELTHDQDAILKQVESGDFSLDDVSDHLDMLEEGRNKKIENYLHVINKLQSDVVTVTAELDRLHDIESSKSKSLSRIKEWLLMSMKDGEKHEFDLFKVTRVKGRDVLGVLNEFEINKSYFNTVPQSFKLDKKLLLTDLKAGIEVKGAEITTGNASLRIK